MNIFPFEIPTPLTQKYLKPQHVVKDSTQRSRKRIFTTDKETFFTVDNGSFFRHWSLWEPGHKVLTPVI